MSSQYIVWPARVSRSWQVLAIHQLVYSVKAVVKPTAAEVARWTFETSEVWTAVCFIRQRVIVLLDWDVLSHLLAVCCSLALLGS